MRAAIFRQSGLVVDEIAAPRPLDGQVVVKTLACGICGSDLHFVHHADHVADVFERTGSPFLIDTSRDIVMGHEFCGEVMERTSGPDGFAAGTRVCSVPFAIEPPHARLLGFSADRPGGFGQYMVLNEANLVPVPNGLSATEAALAEPMAVGVHAVARGRVTCDDVALVVGCGPIGLAVIAALKVAGVERIVAADFNAARRDVAMRMGATVAIDPAHASPYESWAAMALPAGYDAGSIEAIFRLGPAPRPTIIFECVGVPGMLQRTFEGALGGTRIVVVGVCMQSDAFEPLFPLQKELDVTFAFFYDAAEFTEALHHIAEGRIDVRPMITGQVGLDGIGDAFDALASGTDHIKIVVDPWA